MNQSCDQLDAFWKTKELYQRWYWWRCTEDLGLCGQNTLAALVESESNGLPPHNLTDDEALELDKGLAQLIVKNEAIGSLTKAYFVYGQSYKLAAKYEEKNERRATRDIDAGIAWLDAYLAAHEIWID